MNDATLELIDTPVTDIVERLREARSDYHNPLMQEAADEIERLRAAIRKYLSHQLSHAESYKVFQETLDDRHR